MGIEKPIDGAGPLSDFLSRVKSAISGVMPDSVGQTKGSIDLKVTVDTSDVDRAEISLDRLKVPVGQAPLAVPTLLHRDEREHDLPTPGKDATPPTPVPTLLRREEREELETPDPGVRRTKTGPASDADSADTPTPLRRDDRKPAEPPPGQDRYSQIVAEAEAAMKDRTPENIAEAKWQKIKGEGSKAAFDKVANFGSIWGKNLGDESKEEMSGWMKAAGHKEASTYRQSYDDMEKAGDRMGELVKQIKKFGEASPQAVKAAQEILHLQEKIEEMSKSARDSADSIGGDQGALLRAEAEKLKQSALGEGVPETGGKSGRSYSPHDLYRMAQNPEGAIKQFAFEGIMKKISEAGLTKALLAPTITGSGGAVSALGGGAVGGAAVAGMGVASLVAGFAAGWKFNTNRAEAAVQDAHGKISDMRASRALGNDFDFRGEVWNKSRTHSKSFDEMQAMGITNPRMAFETAQALGITADNFQGARPGDNHRGGAQGILRLGQNIQNTALDSGVEGGALSQFVGMSMRSGETGRGEAAGNKLLGAIHAELVEAKKVGISSNEKLGVLASMRQQEQATTGYVSEGSVEITQGLARLLDQTKSPSVMGQAGSSVLGQMGKGGSQEYMAMQMGWAVQGGQLTKEGRDAAKHYLGKDELKLMEEQHTDPYSIMEDLQKKPGFQQEHGMRFIHENRGKLDPFRLQMALGMQGVTHAQFAHMMDIDKKNPDIDKSLAALKAEDPAKKPLSSKMTGLMKKESFDAMDLEGASAIQKDVLQTTMEIKEALMTIKMNTEKDHFVQNVAAGINEAKTGISRMLAEGTVWEHTTEWYGQMLPSHDPKFAQKEQGRVRSNRMGGLG